MSGEGDFGTEKALLERVAQRHRPSIARAISLIEKQTDLSESFYLALQAETNSVGVRVGVTGPPGAGKSTLISALAEFLISNNKRVAILAIDPSSSFTNGAILGDRVRMLDLPDSDDVYIRSMATRGKRGGLAYTTNEVSDLLAYAGYDYIFIESVGVGQAELEIRDFVDTTMVVLVPESGDRVQAIKAGLMEIADIYVINKCDRPGSNTAMLTVQSSLSFQHRYDADWAPVVLGTEAKTAIGIEALFAEIGRHAEHCSAEGRHISNRTHRVATRLKSLSESIVVDQMNDKWEQHSADVIQQVINNKLSLRAAAKQLLEK